MTSLDEAAPAASACSSLPASASRPDATPAASRDASSTWVVRVARVSRYWGRAAASWRMERASRGWEAAGAPPAARAPPPPPAPGACAARNSSSRPAMAWDAAAKWACRSSAQTGSDDASSRAARASFRPLAASAENSNAAPLPPPTAAPTPSTSAARAS